MTARHHHYLSQFYLKGFSKAVSKKSKLTVVDFKLRKIFETTPRNVGGVRDFNRVEVAQLEPDYIETSLSSFESLASKAIKEIQENLLLSNENRNIILNLIALYAVRSPQKREQFRESQEQISDRILDLLLATKNSWNQVVEKMKAAGESLDESVSYEDLKDFYKRKAYKIVVPTEEHLILEMVGMDTVLKLLNQRNWLIYYLEDDSETFITSDNPTILSWNRPENLPPLYRDSPGFGLKDTRVFFPLTRKLFLVGEFGGHSGFIKANQELVSILNSMVIIFAHKQIYSPKIGFHFRGKDNNIDNGNNIFNFYPIGIP